MSDALVTQLARALNLPPDAARHTLDHLVAALREQLDATGETRVPGLGTFYRDEEGLDFFPDDGLARAVNHRYAGLRPIEAGPSSSRRERETEPEDAFEDPFAEATLEEPLQAEGESPDEDEFPDEETLGPDADLPETAIGFQPLQSFIEPEEDEDEAEPEPQDESEEVGLEATDTEETGLGAPGPAPSFEAPQPDEPRLEEESVEEEPQPAPDAPSFDEGRPFEEEPTLEDEPGEVEDEPEEASDEDVLAGIWAEGPEASEEEHVLGPLPSEEIEEAEYDVVEPDEPAAELPSDVGHDEAWDEVPAHAGGLDDDHDDALSDEEAEPEHAAALPPPPAEPPPISEESPPEPDAEPVEPHTVAPAVAATADAPPDREPVATERRRGVPVFLTVLGVALVVGVVALLWLLSREPAGPDLTERPAPADTASVAAVPTPADTLATADTATVAEAPTPEPEEPAAPADPLRGAAGIDPAEGGFTWVVASELDRAVAERRADQYREQGLRADVVAQEAGGRTRYRVSLGQFDSVADAEARRADLPPDVPADSWILRL